METLPVVKSVDRVPLLILSVLSLAVLIVTSTGSTNADLLARAAAEPGGAEGRVLVAEEQTAGRGRRGRTWSSVPGESLTFSVLLRPASVPPDRRGGIPASLRAQETGQASIRGVSASPNGIDYNKEECSFAGG